MKNLEKNISLLCPVCGNKMFEDLNENIDDLSDDECFKYKCANCNRIFTKKELLDANQLLIDATVEEIENDAIKQIEKELKKAFK